MEVARWVCDRANYELYTVLVVAVGTREHHRDRFEQSVDGTRFFEERLVAPQRSAPVEELVGVAGEVEDFQIGLTLSELGGESIAVHFGHLVIGQEEIRKTIR